MFKVMGQVLVKETGFPLAQLQIVLYDLDNLNAQTSAKNPLELFTSNLGPLVWQSFPGDRLGSVITDANGKFELLFDVSAFKAREQGKNPDLVLFVVAPEDSFINDKGIAEPRANETAKRILHISYDVVANAGIQESYMIRISDQLLKKSSLSSTAPTLMMSQAQTWMAEQDYQKTEAPFLQARQKQQQQSRDDSLRFIQGFSSVSETSAQSMFFAGDGKTKAGRAKQKVALAQAANTGMLWLAEYKNRMQPQTSLYLTDDRVRDLEARGHIRADISGYFINSVCSLLSGTLNSVALERVRNLLEAQRANHPIPDPEDPADPDEDPQDPGPVLPAEEQIRQRILGQIQHLETPTLNGTSNGVMNNLLKMLQELKAGQTGPADVTAIKDFHSLQIAFPHVWVEAFDEHFIELTRDLYEDTVQLHQDYGLEPPRLENLTELNDYRDFLNEVRRTRKASLQPVPDSIHAVFPEVSVSGWNSLATGQKLSLLALVINPRYSDEEKQARGNDILRNPQGSLSRLERLTLELEEMLAEPYAFHYFAPNSVNFGLMTTYRQEWQPETYQVGDLVATIPLAPNESRKFTTRQTVKTTRSQKELEKSLSSRAEESQQTRRAEDEILDRAQVSTNFQMTAQGSLNFGIGEIGGSTQFSLNQAQESSRVKKSFHEAVMKAAFEYKNERSIEVETTSSAERETTTSGEISNPNNEITVTYLLYELERRFKVSEKLHRVTPVILVAQDVPAPHEIDEDWLLAHEWILRRVLLDDSFHSALSNLSGQFVQGEVSLDIKKANWQAQKNLVAKLETQVESFLRARDSLRDSLSDLTRRQDEAESAAPDDLQRGFLNLFTGGLSEVAGAFAGAFAGASDGEKLEAQRKVAEMRLEYLKDSLSDAQMKLSSAADALNQATHQYTRGLEAQTQQRTSVDQLRMHIKQNILYYMQAIWDHEPPDQRFFRLYHVTVEMAASGTEVCHMRLATAAEIARGIPGIRRDGRLYVVECSAPRIPSPDSRVTKTLVEIADLDRPLGFKGNYMIFPLKECTYLTDFMMQEYIDDYFGLRDPDPLGNFTTDELFSYAEIVRPTLTPAERQALDQMISERMTHPRRDSDTVIVPTGQLFIEALTGAHSLLEPFKMLHRALDVAKVETEVRTLNLENLRRAARLIGDNQEDPDIDKKIVVEGNLRDLTLNPEA